MKSAILMLIVVGLLISLIPSAYAQTTVTLQETGINLIDDAYVYSGTASTNYGTATSFSVGGETSGFLDSFVKYNITDFSSVPSGDVLSVILGLYMYSTFYNAGDGNITAYCSDQLNIQEETITWNNRPTTGLSLGGYNTTSLHVIPRWVLINITDCFKNYVGGDNISIYINDSIATVGDNDYGNFRSRDYVSDATKHPFLEVTYIPPAVDSTPPDLIDFVPPTLDSGVWINYNYVYVNATFNESDVGSCDVEFGGTNQTGTITGEFCYYNATELADNMYSYKVYVTDNTGNVNVSVSRSVNVDTIAPYGLIFITPSPTESSWALDGQATFNMTFIEDNPDTCLIELDSTNISATIDGEFCYYTKTSLGDAEPHNYLMYLNDSASNLNATETVSFNSDADRPINFQFVFPTPTPNGTASTINDYTMNWSFENTDSGDNCWVYVYHTGDGTTGNQTSDNEYQTSCDFIEVGNSQGFYIYTPFILETGSDNLVYSNVTWWYTIDSLNPENFYWVSPTPSNNTWLAIDNFVANFTFEESNADSCWIDDGSGGLHYGIPALMPTESFNTYYCVVSLTGLADDIYEIEAYANDTVGLVNYDIPLRIVNVDTTSPSSISFVDPTLPDLNSTTDSFIEINVTFTEDNVASCLVQIANATTNNFTGLIVDGSCYFNAGGQSEDDVMFVVYITDSAGNVGVSAERTITVDFETLTVPFDSTSAILGIILVMASIVLLALLSRQLLFKRETPLTTDEIATIFIILSIGVILIGVMASLI
ncbi:DNRLRE domain-containing protein [Patescibacteria group bacterium]|nr:DNRLRE domain-containing protein [Patescibacteria group bacterium]